MYNACYLDLRILNNVLIQEVKIHNPGSSVAQLSLEKLGIAQWEGATSQTKVPSYRFYS